MRTLLHLLSFKHIFPSNIDIKGVSKQVISYPHHTQKYMNLIALVLVGTVQLIAPDTSDTSSPRLL